MTLPPHVFPFYDDLVRSSGCETNNYEVELGELVTQLSAETPPEHWHTPAGFLIHAMRAGSTAAANMVGASPDVVVLKEPKAMTDALMLADSIHDATAAGHAPRKRVFSIGPSWCSMQRRMSKQTQSSWYLHLATMSEGLDCGLV